MIREILRRWGVTKPKIPGISMRMCRTLWVEVWEYGPDPWEIKMYGPEHLCSDFASAYQKKWAE